MLIKKGIPERISDTIMKGVGLCVMYIGWSGTLECKNTIILIVSVVLGALIGEGIDIDRRFNAFAKRLEDKLSKKDKKESDDEKKKFDKDVNNVFGLGTEQEIVVGYYPFMYKMKNIKEYSQVLTAKDFVENDEIKIDLKILDKKIFDTKI